MRYAFSRTGNLLLLSITDISPLSLFSQFSSVTQSCPTLCDHMNHSTPGLPVHHQLPEFTQTHVHRVGDAPSHLILCRPLLLLPQIPPSITITHLQKKAVKKTNPYLIVTPPNYIKYSCLWNHKSNEIWKKAKQIFQTATNLTHFKDSNLNLFPRFILFDLMKHWKHHASYKPDTKELILWVHLHEVAIRDPEKTLIKNQNRVHDGYATVNIHNATELHT